MITNWILIAAISVCGFIACTPERFRDSKRSLASAPGAFEPTPEDGNSPNQIMDSLSLWVKSNGKRQPSPDGAKAFVWTDYSGRNNHLWSTQFHPAYGPRIDSLQAGLIFGGVDDERHSMLMTGGDTGKNQFSFFLVSNSTFASASKFGQNLSPSVGAFGVLGPLSALLQTQTSQAIWVSLGIQSRLIAPRIAPPARPDDLIIQAVTVTRPDLNSAPNITILDSLGLRATAVGVLKPDAYFSWATIDSSTEVSWSKIDIVAPRVIGGPEWTGPGNFEQGKATSVMELIVFNTALSPSNSIEVMEYLGTKYGIAVHLPNLLSAANPTPENPSQAKGALQKFLRKRDL